MSEHTIWETKGAGPVRILCTDKPGDWPIAGYFVEKGDLWEWLPDGQFTTKGDSVCDLIIPEGTVIEGGK